MLFLKINHTEKKKGDKKKKKNNLHPSPKTENRKKRHTEFWSLIDFVNSFLFF